MRHLYDKPHLNRSKSHRKALFGNMSAALFLNKRITTTLGKARYARRFAERMITFARKGDVAARRHVVKFIRDKEAIKTLFDELGPHFKHREGGYTRIIKIGTRRGDAAPMCIIELVGFDDTVASSTPKKESKSKLKASQKAVVSKRKTGKKEAPAVEAKETEIADEAVLDTTSDEEKSDTVKKESKSKPKASKKAVVDKKKTGKKEAKTVDVKETEIAEETVPDTTSKEAKSDTVESSDKDTSDETDEKDSKESETPNKDSDK
ncbi:MAG: 50S ribosomal protein L17 [Calditrichaeota bacterium]|nr:50S ribosomal protein L17 [Calditrichota bacterium]